MCSVGKWQEEKVSLVVDFTPVVAYGTQQISYRKKKGTWPGVLNHYEDGLQSFFCGHK